MAAVELILLQRVEKLGQMGDLVRVKPGYARNFLLPQKKALRASKDNLARFESQRAQLEAQNLKRREEAERLAERVGGLSVVIIRQAGESGSLYGSVSVRDIADAATAAGLTINRQQVILQQPIKPHPGARRAPPRGDDPGHGQRGAQPRGSREAGPRRSRRHGRRGPRRTARGTRIVRHGLRRTAGYLTTASSRTSDSGGFQPSEIWGGTARCRPFSLPCTAT